jgi:glycosyltransferase involved in cell wall biosynthesis
VPLVALLTGGGDKPYVVGLTTSLVSRAVSIDLIGSDALDCPEFQGLPGLTFRNLRGSQRADVSLVRKIMRVSMYYARLIRYSAMAQPKIFHILWNNKFEFLDRTALMLYYKMLGKRVILTVHNVNMARRDSLDTALNRLTLRIQYRLADHLFVHTERMKQELEYEFGVTKSRVTVIPFGINNAVPNTHLTSYEAKDRLGIRECEKTILFFGRISPSKGLEYLIVAFRQVLTRSAGHRLIIAGRPDNCKEYWEVIQKDLRPDVENGRIMLRPTFIPDEEVEVYFKAADVLALPYTDIYQSGVLFLAANFGLPVVATDVGSFKEEIVEGKTGFLCKPKDPSHLARAIENYFASDLYSDLTNRRREIRDYVLTYHSWEEVSQITKNIYMDLDAALIQS